MRSLLVASVLASAVMGVLVLGVSEEIAYAKGTAIGFMPDAGPAHEEVMVSGGSWPENTEVRLFVAFSPIMEGSYPPADEFVGPFEVVRSDTEGRWEALITPDTIVGLGLPGEPGYLIVRAESDDLPLYLEGANSNHFVLTVDGQRPAGSGKVEISITFESEPEFARYGGYSVRRAGGDHFQAPNSVGISLPSNGRTLSIPLPDGDFEVALSIGGNLEVSPGPNIKQVSGETLCFEDLCVKTERLFVLSVTVANAEVVRADFVLRPTATVQPEEITINALVASPSPDDGRGGLIIGTLALGVVLIVGAFAVVYRRATG